MSNFKRVLDILKESPKLNDEERLSYLSVFKISKNAFKRAYEVISEIRSGYYLTVKKETGQYFTVTEVNSEILAILKIDVRKTPFPVKPTKLTNPIQVSMVRIADGFQNERITKLSYIEIVKTQDLVSDYEQYEASKNLWKSLAKSNEVNVYVFNGKTNDYFRSEDGNIILFNSSNILENKIWKNTNEHKNILLVATIKNLE